MIRTEAREKREAHGMETVHVTAVGWGCLAGGPAADVNGHDCCCGRRDQKRPYCTNRSLGLVMMFPKIARKVVSYVLASLAMVYPAPSLAVPDLTAMRFMKV
jgi:hypothetical protein